MPLPTSRPDSDDLSGSLINAVQYAHLLHEIRRSPSMGTVFHIANYRHWKDLSMDRVVSVASLELRDNMIQGIFSMSCKLLLQMLQTANLEQSGGGLGQLWTMADAELNALIDKHEQRAAMQDCTLSALDGLDVFSIAIYNVGRLQIVAKFSCTQSICCSLQKNLSDPHPTVILPYNYQSVITCYNS